MPMNELTNGSVSIQIEVATGPLPLRTVDRLSLSRPFVLPTRCDQDYTAPDDSLELYLREISRVPLLTKSKNTS